MRWERAMTTVGVNRAARQPKGSFAEAVGNRLRVRLGASQ
jgi:hypothetical protein